LWRGLGAADLPWLAVTSIVFVRVIGFSTALARELFERGGELAARVVAIVLLLAMPATLTTCLVTQAEPAVLCDESKEALGDLVIAYWQGHSPAEIDRWQRKLVETSRSASPLVRARVTRLLDQVTRNCSAPACYPKADVTTEYLNQSQPTKATKLAITGYVRFVNYKHHNRRHLRHAVVGLGVPIVVLLLLGFGRLAKSERDAENETPRSEAPKKETPC